jgi:hypothetical protein
MSFPILIIFQDDPPPTWYFMKLIRFYKKSDIRLFSIKIKFSVFF